MSHSEPAAVRSDYHARVRTEVLDLVPEGPNRVLDVGGGIGASAAWLKSVGKCDHAVVVDLVADNCLPEIDAGYGGNLEDPALLQRVASEQGKMDVILCLDVLEHVTDPWAVVKHCHDILNPGGVIVTSIPNMRHYSLVLPLVFRGKFDLTDSGIRDRTHLRWFVKDTAIDLMTSSGLKLDHVEGKIYGRKKNLLNTLTLGLFREFLFLQYFIRVRR
jgi:2-polyprenyl-3-methyl-5-hydroxy-6-metoxy-1,4-benzoquinol methylase